jgi:hypothetical protein
VTAVQSGDFSTHVKSERDGAGIDNGRLGFIINYVMFFGFFGRATAGAWVALGRVPHGFLVFCVV